MQIGVGPAEHRTLQGFEPVALAFRLPIAPALDHRVSDPLYVDDQGPGEVRNSWYAAVLGFVAPSAKFCLVMTSQRLRKRMARWRIGAKPDTSSFKTVSISDLALGRMLFYAMSSIQRHAATLVATTTEFADDTSTRQHDSVQSGGPGTRPALPIC